MTLFIKRNIIRCLGCNDILESTHRYDYRACRCRRVSVDGGLDYLKRGFPSPPP
ncbi:DUF7695 domain-containing protein [Paenibacillus tarimensis]